MRGILLPHALLWPKFRPALALLFAIALSSCSFADGDNSSGRAPPPAAQQQVAAAPTPMDTFRAFAPPEGMKFTPLFAIPVDNTDDRFRRLENAVQAVRNDFDTVTPSLVRLVAIEKDIKELVDQLKSLTEGGSAVNAAPLPPPTRSVNRIPGEDIVGGTDSAEAEQAEAEPTADTSLVTPEAASEGKLPPEGAASPSSPPTPPISITPKKAEPPVSAPAAPKGPSLGDIKNLRIGDHLNKTRIVLDITVRAPYTATLENNGKRLVIDMPQMAWEAAQKSWDASTAVLVSGWRYEGGKVVIDLLFPSTIKMQDILPPNGTPYNRLVIDLFSKDAHEG